MKIQHVCQIRIHRCCLVSVFTYRMDAINYSKEDMEGIFHLLLLIDTIYQ